MACVTTRRLQINSLISPWTQWRITCCIIQAVSSFPIFRMIISIRQIIDTVSFMYPSCFMEIFQTFHRPQRLSQFHHIVFHFGPNTAASTTIIEISLFIIIHENTRIYHGKTIVFHANHLNKFLMHCKILSRMFTGCNSHSPSMVPVRSTGMGEIIIIGSIFISTIGCPHKTSFLSSP